MAKSNTHNCHWLYSIYNTSNTVLRALLILIHLILIMILNGVIVIIFTREDTETYSSRPHSWRQCDSRLVGSVRDRNNFSVKGWTVNTLGFVGHTFSVTTTQLCHDGANHPWLPIMMTVFHMYIYAFSNIEDGLEVWKPNCYLSLSQE